MYTHRNAFTCGCPLGVYMSMVSAFLGTRSQCECHMQRELSPEAGPHGPQLCCLGVLAMPIICSTVLVKYSLHPLPTSASRRGPHPGLRSPAHHSCCQQSSVGTGQLPHPTEAVPLTPPHAGPLPAAPGSCPFLDTDSRKFTLDLTCISPKETAPCLHLNSPGCPHPFPGALISCQPRTGPLPIRGKQGSFPSRWGSGVREMPFLPLTALCSNTAIIHRPQ